MRVYGVTAFIFVIGLGTATAQEVFAHPLTDRARPEVTTIAERMAAHRLVTASFIQTKRIAKLGKTFVSRGRMIFDASRGLVWETKSPFPGTLIMTKDAVKRKMSDGTTTVLALGDNDTFKRFSLVLQAVFSGDCKSIEEGFSVFYLPEAGGKWSIGLRPRDKTLAAVIKGLVLTGASDLTAVTLIETTSDSVEYRFTDIVFPPSLNAADEKAFF